MTESTDSPETTPRTARLTEAQRLLLDRMSAPAGRREGLFPATAAQRGMWTAEQLGTGASAFHMPALLRLRGPLDTDRLARAVQRLVDAHEALRTTLVTVDGVPLQHVRAARVHRLEIVGAEGRDEQEVIAEAVEAAQLPFDLAVGPLLRTALWRLAAADHLLLVVLHHSAGDAWSLGVLLEDLATAPAGAEPGTTADDGAAAALTLSALQPVDLALRERAAGRDEPGASFWAEQLAGAAPLRLPGPDFELTGSEPACGSLRLPLSDGLVRRVHELARRCGTTDFTVYFTALAAVCHRFTGQRDLVLGASVARRGPGTERTVGLLVNTLPVRLRWTGPVRFDELVSQCASALRSAMAHGDVPLERIVQGSAADRTGGRSPLLNAVFSLVADPLAGVRLGACAAERLPVPARSAKFPLLVSVETGPAGASLVAEYDRAALDGELADSLIRALRQVLEQAVTAPATGIDAIALLDEVALAACLDRAQGPASEDLLRGEGMGVAVADMARRHPQRTALIEGNRRVSYAELLACADGLAARLLRDGAGQDRPVAVVLPRGIDQIASCLAVVRAGGHYLPLDPAQPAQRTRYMIEQAGARLVVAQSGDLGAQGGTVVPPARPGLPGTGEPPGSEPPAVDLPAGRPEDLLLVGFTSGSTGRPKGYAITQLGLAGLIGDRRYHTRAADRVFLIANTVAFDASTWEIWSTLLDGATGVIVPEYSYTAGALGALIREHGATTLHVTTQLFNAVVDEDPHAFRPLSELVIGGEAMSAEHVRRAVRCLPGTRLLNAYGPAECAVMATIRELDAPPAGARRVPIGTPAAGTSVYVLDDRLRPVPPGVPGQIFIGGRRIGRGYVNRPGLTAERFVPSPFARGERMYRTGDLARVRRDGTLVYLGRTDQQVKIRGFRVEPGEVEACLTRHSAVARAVVVPAPSGGLTAYIVPAGMAPGVSQLRDFLRAQLPDHMIPTAVVTLDEIPRTANGKIDRAALPAPERTVAGRPPVAPRDELEQTVAAVWAEVLARPAGTLSVHEDFFEAGGHSLLAARASARLERRLGRAVPLRMLFERPTVAGLAQALRGARAADDGPELAPRPAAPAAAGRPPVSFAQQRLWFLHQMAPESALYNLPLAVRLTGVPDPQALHRALRWVSDRHEALRTVFAAGDDGAVYQHVLAPRDVPLTVIATAGPPESRRRSADRAVRQAALAPFDLAVRPPIRAHLVAAADREHILVLTVHHIACDGWSAEILAREVSAAYAAALRGTDPDLPAPPVQYADFAVWQRARLTGPARQAELDHWTRVLDGAPQVLELPADHPRPAVFRYRGGTEPVSLDPELTAALRRAAGENRVTGFMVLAAGLAVMLHRYTGRDDLLIGIPVAGRSHPRTEGLVGFFANTLVLRISLRADPSAWELLERVHAACLDAYEHQELPFEQLVEHLRPERDLSRTPLFQVMLAAQGEPMAGVALPGLDATPYPVDNPGARCDLTVLLREGARTITGALEYNSDLFAPESAARMARHLTRALAWLSLGDGTRLSGADLIGDEERAWLAQAGTGPAPALAHQATVLALIEARAAADPGAAAVAGADGTQLSYRGLLRRARSVAAALAAAGVRRGDVVGLLVHRSPDALPAMIGTWLAGAAFVPLDPAYPEDRLRYMAEDAGAVAVVAGPGLVGPGLVAAGIPGRTLMIDDVYRVPDAAADGFDPVAVTGLDPAYVLYTSGSTGRPKGVVIGHAGLAVLLSSAAERPGLTAADRLVALTSFSFDMGMLELFGPLAAGGTVVIATPEQAHDPVLLDDLLRDARATVVQATPATWRMLLDSGWRAARPLRVWAGGEALPAELAETLLAAGHELWNGYGPTETTVYSTLARISDPADITIGRPVAGTEIHLLDAALNPVPAGTVGEICIGGAGVAHGYRGRPALTADRFVPSPRGAGARLYRTGDLGRWDPHGRLLYLGRLDRQIKLRGLRIEPGEVETRLARRPGVRDCAVTVHRGALVAYLVADSGEAADPVAVREFLRADLPEYMVPTVVVRLNALPLTANGKVDRAVLPEPLPAPDAPAGRVAPRSAAEHSVAEVWSAVLGRPRDLISVLDDFFDLGGHSLLATSVAGRLSAQFGRRVPVRLIFEHPTAAALAEALASSSAPIGPDAPADGADPDGSPLPRVADRERMPLSFAQERLWFLHRLDPAAPLYNVPLALRLTGDLRTELLHRALLTVIGEHEALRTAFAEQDGESWQRVLPPSIHLTVVELPDRGVSADDTLATVLRHAGYAPFDLAALQPPIRATLVRLSEQQHVLLVTVHHIACDGWSTGLLARRVAQAYTALCEGRSPEPARLPAQYGDFAAWQRGRLTPQSLEAELAHWDRVLAGAPAVLELPTDHPRPAVFEYRGAGIPIDLGPQATASVRDLAAAHRMTPFMVLAAALAVVLGRYSGQDDVVIGTPLAGRTRPELEPLIGFFANTLVLRFGLSGAPAVAGLLARVRDTCLDAYSHQEVPFERLVEHLQPARDLSRTPIFQVMLALQNDPVPDLALPGLKAEPHRVDNPTAKYDLVFTLREDVATISGLLEYNSDLFAPQSAGAIRDAFTAVLAALPRTEQVADLPCCPPAELDRLLNGWNRVPSYDPETRLHDLVARQVAATPDAVAVICDEPAETLTYAELDHRSSRLARALVQCGVGADDLVAVLLPRRADLVVAVLAVLRAGAGFLPLDPELPAGRLAAVLDDARVRVTVTDDALAGLISGCGQTIVRPGAGGDPGEGRGRPAAGSPDGMAVPGSLAYAVYTSGSTGRPKGALIAHRAICNNLLWMQADWPLDGHDRLLQKTTIAFDVAVKEVFWPLLAGAAVVLARPGGQRDPEYLMDLIDRYAVTVAHFVPSMLDAALSYAERTGRAFGPRLEKVMSGAETLPASTLRRFFAATSAELLHMYGPTETAIAVTGWTCPPGHVPERVPLGTPMPGARLYVLDARLRPAPRGAWGELYAAGLCLGRGYLNRPAETAAAFLPDPFGDEPGARMYRTGDIVRIGPGGLLEFRGRTDHQVKVRGFRVELGDVEAALNRHPDVRQAAVLARRSPDGVAHSLAGYVATGRDGLSEHEVRDHLRAVLPEYMVPATITVLTALPVNANGKIDRDRLPEPLAAAVPRGGPGTALEQVVAGVLAEVLGLPGAGADDDLFTLGGHSLQVPQIAALLAERTGVELPLREIFLAPTPAGIARAVQGIGSAAPAVPAITRVDRAARRVDRGTR